MIAPRVNWTTLIATLLAFFLAVGVAAHALDELRGRPLGTAMPSWLLSGAAALGLGGPWPRRHRITRVGFGCWPSSSWGVLRTGLRPGALWRLVHTDFGFAVSWARSRCSLRRTPDLHHHVVGAVLALAAALLSAAQRNLSNPVRMIRRRSRPSKARSGSLTVLFVDRPRLLIVPSERALRSLAIAMIALSVAFVLVRRVH